MKESASHLPWCFLSLSFLSWAVPKVGSLLRLSSVMTCSEFIWSICYLFLSLVLSICCCARSASKTSQKLDCQKLLCCLRNYEEITFPSLKMIGHNHQESKPRKQRLIVNFTYFYFDQQQRMMLMVDRLVLVDVASHLIASLPFDLANEDWPVAVVCWKHHLQFVSTPFWILINFELI